MDYKPSYNALTGKLVCIIRLKDKVLIPICEDNADYREFLLWNSQQQTPLDLNSTIEPVKPESEGFDLATAAQKLKEIDTLKARVQKLEKQAK